MSFCIKGKVNEFIFMLHNPSFLRFMRRNILVLPARGKA